MGIGSGLQAQLGAVAEVYTNEVQQLSGTPSGTFGLNFDGALTTISLATNASAASVQAALEALPNIGTGGVACAGGALPTAITVTFSGALVAGRNVPALSVQGAITGLTFATNTPGTGYGDVQTPTRFWEFVSETLELTSERIVSSTLRVANQVARTDRFAVNRKGVTGDIELEMQTKGMGLLVAHAYGAVAAVTTPGGATLTRRHTHVLGTHWNRSLTIQKGIPRTTSEASNVQAITELGCKFTEIEWTQELDDFLKLKLTVDGYDESTATSLAAASFASTTEVFHFGQAQVSIAGANVLARKFSLKIPRPLDTERYFLRQNTLKREPILNELTEATGEIELEFDSLAQYNRFAATTPAGTLAAVVATWTTATLIEATFPYRVEHTIPAARFDGASPQIEGPDLVVVTYPFTVMNDGTLEPITTVIDTTDTAS